MTLTFTLLTCLTILSIIVAALAYQRGSVANGYTFEHVWPTALTSLLAFGLSAAGLMLGYTFESINNALAHTAASLLVLSIVLLAAGLDIRIVHVAALPGAALMITAACLTRDGNMLALLVLAIAYTVISLTVTRVEHELRGAKKDARS